VKIDECVKPRCSGDTGAVPICPKRGVRIGHQKYIKTCGVMVSALDSRNKCQVQ